MKWVTWFCKMCPSDKYKFRKSTTFNTNSKNITRFVAVSIHKMMCILFKFVNWESLKEEYTEIILRGSTYKKASTHINNEQDSRQPVCLRRANTVSVISVCAEFAYLITKCSRRPLTWVDHDSNKRRLC